MPVASKTSAPYRLAVAGVGGRVGSSTPAAVEQLADRLGEPAAGRRAEQDRAGDAAGRRAVPAQSGRVGQAEALDQARGRRPIGEARVPVGHRRSLLASRLWASPCRGGWIVQSIRRVAVIGGNRIPFARSNGRVRAPRPTRTCSTAALDGLVARFGLAGAAARRGGRRRGAQALAATSTSPARWCSARGSTRTPRRTTSSRPAAPAWRRRSWSPTRSPSGRSTSGIAGGVDTTSDAPLARQRGDAPHAAASSTAPARSASGSRPRRSCARSQPFKPEIPRNAEPRTGLSMGEHAALHRAALGASTGRPRTSWRCASHQRLAAAYERGFFDDLVTPYLGLTRDQNLRADTTPGEARRAQAGLRHTGPDAERATMTAGNSSPLTDGAVDGAAGQRGVGRARTTCRCWPSSAGPRPPPSTSCTATRGC